MPLDLVELYRSQHKQPQAVASVRNFCTHPRFFPTRAVVHLHGIWTSLHELFVLTMFQPTLKYTLSESDPKAYPTLNSYLENPERCLSIRKAWQLLKPVLPTSLQDFQHALHQFKQTCNRQCSFVLDATERSTKIAIDTKPSLQHALEVCQNYTLLHDLLTMNDIPKADLVFCHALQYNPYHVANRHLKKKGVLFYTIHREDSFSWEKQASQHGLIEHSMNNHPAARLLNPQLSEFPTHPPLYMLEMQKPTN